MARKTEKKIEEPRPEDGAAESAEPAGTLTASVPAVVRVKILKRHLLVNPSTRQALYQEDVALYLGTGAREDVRPGVPPGFEEVDEAGFLDFIASKPEVKS